jgi:hypothetical protein
LRAFPFAILLLAACAQAPAHMDPPAPAVAPPPPALSPLAREVHDELVGLDAELSAPGVASAEIGQTADLGGGLYVRPYAIVEDSRCPHHTQCLWEGRMRIRVSVSGRESELILGGALDTPNGRVRFVAVSPGAWAEWPSSELGPRPAYRFGFRGD